MAPRKMAHIYRQVPSDQDEATIGLEFEPRKRRGFSRFSRVAITMAVLALLLLVVLSSALRYVEHIIYSSSLLIRPASTYGSPSGSKSCDEIQQGYQCKPEISHFWGQYSPYYSVPSEIPAEIPEACKVTFVQVLSRHGARDPTASKTVIYAALIAKLHSNVQSFKGKYAFLKDYKYSLGADQLTTFGQQQLINSGIKFYERYRPLARSLPIFVRSSGQARVVESAQNFTQGYHNTRLQDKGSSDIDGYPYPILEISEDDGMNNTLNHDLCNAFEDGPASKVGSDAQLKWQSIFAPVILGRLNKELPGASLTVAEVVLFMDLCPFESVSSRTGMVSPFCNLFTEQEWHQYDYFQSLGKYYGYGPGNPLGPTQGVGYVNELVARMTGKPVQDHTSVNHTLDDSHKTFPFGHGHHLFADFSHDKYCLDALFSGRCTND
jgi:hypothetical protein